MKKNQALIEFLEDRKLLSGTGLQGQYFTNNDLTGTSVTRVDKKVDFNWNKKSPADSVSANNFSVQWTGQVQPTHSGTYTFYTKSNGGVRLWVNGQLLIDNWTDHAKTTDSATIDLVAGQSYDVKMEYYNDTGKATAELMWSRKGSGKQAISTSHLYPPGSDDSLPTPTPSRSKPVSKPSAPSNLAATATSNSQIDLTWTDNSTNESGFKVYRSTNNKTFTLLTTTAANATTYSDTGLSAGKKYYYRVRATNSAGDSGNSATASATTQAVVPPPTAPTAPSNLTATAKSTSQIDLSWTDNSSNETGFKVQRSTDGTNFTAVATAGANVTSYSDTGLSSGTKYYYRISATNTVGDSANTAVANATTQTAVTVPTAPSSLVATAASASQINLSWADNSNNETGFKVERSTDGTNFTLLTTTAANATSYNDTGLSSGTKYYYRVRATNSAGDSVNTPVANATTQAIVTVPSAPTNLVATAASASQINLAWSDNSNNETGFKVERSTDGTNFTLLTTTAANATSYSDAGLSAGTKYYYRVRATDLAGDSANTSVANATTQTVVTVPSAPSNLVATAASASQINLSWSDNSNNETGFKIERSTDGTNFTSLTTTAANATNYSDTGLSSGTKYYYRVRATDSAGDSTNTTVANATTQTVVTVPSAPSNLVATAASTSQINLSWTDNSNNETGFKIERSTDGTNFTALTTTAANATSYSDTGLSAGTKYYYRVRATDSAGDSANTAVANATTQAAPTAPNAPSNLAATAKSASEIDLTWTDNSSNETGFTLQRSADGTNFSTIATPSANTTSFADTGLSASTKYYYRVMATNSVGNSAASATVNATTSATSTGSTIPTPDHVVVVMEENEASGEIMGSSAAPYINSLASQGAYFSNSYAITHPSQPNYLALFSGSTQGVTDDNATGMFSTQNLGSELIGAGLTFGGYSEGLPSTGSTALTSGEYARKHNPWSDFSNVPTSDNMPMTSFPTDFSKLPTVSFVVPNLMDDMHDGTIQQGDTWLQQNIAAYAQWAQTHNSVLIVTWDEDDSSGPNKIPTIITGQNVKPGTYSETINHYNVLSTIESMYSLPKAGSSSSASPITDIWSSTPVSQPTVPGAPSNLLATAASSSQINLSWTDNSNNETGFKIEQSTDGTNWTLLTTTAANVTSYSNTGLSSGTKYYYRVRATNSAGDSANTSVANATTQAVVTTPIAPSNLVATAASSSQINLTWTDNSSNETGFKIERSTDGTNFTSVTTTAANATSYSDTGLSSGTKYYYRVRATNSAGDSANTSVANATTQTVVTVPSAPSSLVATAASSSQINLTWTDNSSNETGFKIERSTDGTNFTALTTTAANATSYSDTNLSAGTKYYYRVRATNSAGDSANTTVANATTQAASSGGTITYSAPITITKGGTYTGNWQSTNANTPAVTIATSDPVTIINSNIQSAGTLISTQGYNANVTIKNTSGYALNPNDTSKYPGRFLDAEGFVNVDVENCYMQGTSGIYLYDYRGNGTASNTVKILKNSAKNIDGRYSDGHGGYTTNAEYVQFFQINGVKNLTGAEVAWNQVVNLPGQSAVEDNISIYSTSGTSASPFLIHDNYIQGAYPADPTSSDYTGGGIMVSDIGSSWIRAYNNQVVSTTNYGIAISSGHDNSFYNNRIISSGLYPDGTPIPAQNVGAYVWNQNNESTFTNNSGSGNLIGWQNGSSRNDSWTPDASSWTGNTAVSGTITLATEQAEWTYWLNKLSTNGVQVGVN